MTHATHTALSPAPRRIPEAERARDEALAQLDAALSAAGWRRLQGAFDPNTKLYAHVANPSAPVPLENVLQAVALA